MLYTTMKTPDKVITNNSNTEIQIWKAIDIFERLWGVRRTRWESLEISKASENNLGNGILAHEQIQAPLNRVRRCLPATTLFLSNV